MRSDSKRPLATLTVAERLNFLLTNRLPRRWLTLAMGRFSKIRHPWVRSASIWIWQRFVDDLRLDEARKSTFDSLHDCFTRELKPGARPVDARSNILISPCDAVVGELGDLNDLSLLQAKGFPYSAAELLDSERRAKRFRDGRYITLRLKSSMYHRFHAPCDGWVDGFSYISGDTWNVNPIALKVVERLFCKNERAVIDFEVDQGAITLVPIAAILVASMRFHGVSDPINLSYRGPNRVSLRRRYRKGDEIGYFEHGSTIVLFATRDYRFEPSIATGMTIRMGQALMSTSEVRNNFKKP